jgi:hypothetical protein
LLYHVVSFIEALQLTFRNHSHVSHAYRSAHYNVSEVKSINCATVNFTASKYYTVSAIFIPDVHLLQIQSTVQILHYIVTKASVRKVNQLVSEFCVSLNMLSRPLLPGLRAMEGSSEHVIEQERGGPPA